MAVASVSQTLALQHEYLRTKLEDLTLASNTLWSRIKTRTDVKAVSNRPSRIPFYALSGGKFRTFDPDGGDMGLGSGPVTAYGTLSSVFYLYAHQYTKLTEYSTDTDSKAIEDYASLTMKEATKKFADYMDAIIQGSGANDLDTVVSVDTTDGYIVVSNANKFSDGQDIDVWSAIGGTKIASLTVLSVDSGTNSIAIDGTIPTTIAAGQVILVSGSTGLANSGTLGLRSYQAYGNTGTYMNIQKSAYPGKFSTPYVNCQGQALTPSRARVLKAQVQLAVGTDRAESNDLIAHMNVDMVAAWENVGIVVTRNIVSEMGKTYPDMQKRKAVRTFMEYEIVDNVRATPGIIDLLATENWFRIESKPIDYYEVGGQTLFPTYGTTGGLSASTLFYLVYGGQLGNGQPREGAYMDNVAIPQGYFNSAA